MQDILETWRLRTPNEWEPVSAWADVLIWRNAIYNVVINAFKNVGEVAPHLHQLGYRDKAWCARAAGSAGPRQGGKDSRDLEPATLLACMHACTPHLHQLGYRDKAWCARAC